MLITEEWPYRARSKIRRCAAAIIDTVDGGEKAFELRQTEYGF